MEQIIGKIYKEVLGENEGVLAKKDKEQSIKEWDCMMSYTKNCRKAKGTLFVNI